MSNQMSRTQNAARSTIAGLVGYIATYAMAFIYRTVFIYTLGSTYLGVQGLFSNILSMLSLAELGISTAVTFSLYKPLAGNDYEKIKSLMLFFKKAYLIIAFVITVAGVSLIPFLDFFVKEPPNIPESLILVYLLYLTDTVVSYLFVHKQALIRADQRVYVISIATNTFSIVRDVVQMILLLTLKAFIPVLTMQVISTFLLNFYLARRANKLFPYLKEKEVAVLDTESKKNISTKIRSLFAYKIGAFVVNGTDNLLISKFIGVITVGIYSNYNTLIAMVKTLTTFFIKAITPSVGNYTATKTVSESEELFLELNFIVFWIFSLCSVMFILLVNPFITVWVGSEYLLNTSTVIILIINFYLYGLHQNQLIYRNVLGLYIYCRWKPIVEAIANIFASLFFINRYGITGVFIGTTISFVCTSLWVEPYVLYKYYFKKIPREYILKFLYYSIFTVTVCVLLYFATSIIDALGIVKILIYGLVGFVGHTALFCLLFARTKEFKKSKDRVMRIIRTKMIKRRNG